jgi:hypothetical protein
MPGNSCFIQFFHLQIASNAMYLPEAEKTNKKKRHMSCRTWQVTYLCYNNIYAYKNINKMHNKKYHTVRVVLNSNWKSVGRSKLHTLKTFKRAKYTSKFLIFTAFQRSRKTQIPRGTCRINWWMYLVLQKRSNIKSTKSHTVTVNLLATTITLNNPLPE